jgi:hypothetical protein
MTQTVIYLGGKNIPILYPALLKDEMAEGLAQRQSGSRWCCHG